MVRLITCAKDQLNYGQPDIIIINSIIIKHNEKQLIGGLVIEE